MVILQNVNETIGTYCILSLVYLIDYSMFMEIKPICTGINIGKTEEYDYESFSDTQTRQK